MYNLYCSPQRAVSISEAYSSTYYHNVDLDYAAAAGSESKEERVQLKFALQEALDASMSVATSIRRSTVLMRMHVLCAKGRR